MTDAMKFWFAKAVVDAGLGIGLLCVVLVVFVVMAWWRDRK